MMTPDRESCRGVILPGTLPEYIWMVLASRSFAEEGDRLQNYLYIAVGGALGSLARYWVATAVANRMGTRFPYGTLIVNMTACLIIGFVITLLGERPGVNPAWRYLIPIGFIGAYSTFSTFEWETFANLQNGAFLMAALYVGLSCVLGLVAVWCGVSLARLCL